MHRRPIASSRIAKSKARNQKIILGVGGVILLLVLAVELPSTLSKLSGNSSAPVADGDRAPGEQPRPGRVCPSGRPRLLAEPGALPEVPAQGPVRAPARSSRDPARLAQEPCRQHDRAPGPGRQHEALCEGPVHTAGGRTGRRSAGDHQPELGRRDSFGAAEGAAGSGYVRRPWRRRPRGAGLLPPNGAACGSGGTRGFLT